MTRRCAPILLTLAALALAATPASAHAFRFYTTLTGPQAVPPTESDATATCDLVYNHHNVRFNLNLEVEGITIDELEPTGPNGTSVHLRYGSPDSTGEIAVDLEHAGELVPTDDGFRLELTTAVLGGSQGEVYSDPVDVAAALQSEQLYAVIHTQDHPEGEIRGRLSVIGAGECPADFTGPNDAPDGQVDSRDFLAFLDAFAAGDVLEADMNLDGMLTTEDFLRYIESYSAGCF